MENEKAALDIKHRFSPIERVFNTGEPVSKKRNETLLYRKGHFVLMPQPIAFVKSGSGSLPDSMAAIASST